MYVGRTKDVKVDQLPMEGVKEGSYYVLCRKIGKMGC